MQMPAESLERSGKVARLERLLGSRPVIDIRGRGRQRHPEAHLIRTVASQGPDVLGARVEWGHDR